MNPDSKLTRVAQIIEKSRGKLILIAAFLIFINSCISQNSPDYESNSGKELVAKNGMVSSAHPLASEAGKLMLEKGGNAVDAAIATAFVLNVVEPEMSGMGGGGGFLYWNQRDKEAVYEDFYPSKRAETYKGLDYEKIEKKEFNLLKVGVPGSVAGYLQALEKYGTLSRQEIMEPAILYATKGFPMYPTLADFTQYSEKKLSRFEGGYNTFFPGGKAIMVGDTLKQPELARTLKVISDDGADAFYKGSLAKDMVEVMNKWDNPVTKADFENYEPKWEKLPLTGTYRGYSVYSAPLPQTGFYIIQALNILENYDLKKMGLSRESSAAFNMLASTLRLSNADRMKYVEDPNWVNTPIEKLISKKYASDRGKAINLSKAIDEVSFGVPKSSVSSVMKDNSGSDLQNKNIKVTDELTYNRELENKYDKGHTTHISVIDTEGSAVSMTTTNSSGFGSGAWVNGYFLNDSGYDFSQLVSEDDWKSNHPYRTRATTISPTIILEDNEVRLVIGAPGGGRIPQVILQNIVSIIDYGLEPMDAVKMPRLFPVNTQTSNKVVQVEKGFDLDVLAEIRQMGYEIQNLPREYANIYLVYRKKDGTLIGVSDIRHDGAPRGF